MITEVHTPGGGYYIFLSAVAIIFGEERTLWASCKWITSFILVCTLRTEVYVCECVTLCVFVCVCVCVCVYVLVIGLIE